MTETSLSGLTALVTGTTSGFGQHFAQVLAEAGAKVALTGRRIDRLQALEATLKAQGRDAAGIALDVTDPASIAACLAETEQRLGPVDILVNNAGMNREGMVADLTPEDFDAVMNTNTRGAFLMAQAVGKRMIDRGAGGRIINIASIGAFKVLPGLVTYCMSKAAVVMMTKGLAREWARHGINVNAICPGYIETEINSDWFATEAGARQVKSFPRKRLGQIQDLDGALRLMASPDSGFLTGSVLTVDDGQSL